MKKIILGLIILISIVFGVFMYQKNSYVHSEAVFVATDSLTNVGFKLDGKINKMTKQEGDFVSKNELLATLETKTLNTKIKEIKYKIISIQNQLSGLSFQKDKLVTELKINKNIIDNEINKTNQKIESLNYQILANEARLKKLKFDKDKFYKLYKSKKISFDKYNKIKTEYEYLLNMILSQKENIKTLKITKNSLNEKLKLNKNNYKNLDILDTKIESLYNQLLSLKEIKNSLDIKIADSKLTSPFDGVIAKKFVNQDTVIKKGSFIYSIVNPKDIYIKVLLSEKKLKGLKIGNKAIVTLDAYNKDIKGKIIKIMPVSASTFSLVPRDIASGEFTKLEQRFIVKIKIPYNKVLRIGMSGEVKIYK